MHCHPVTVVKATAERSEVIKVQNSLAITKLTLGKATLSIENCFDEKKRIICASIQPEPGTHVRLGSNEVYTQELSSQRSQTYQIKSIEYEYRCQELKGKRVCSSPEESPTGYPAKIVKEEHRMVYQGGLEEVYKLAFSPETEFVGVVEKSISLPWTYVRDYKFTLIDTELLNTPSIKAKLPNIWVDGIEYVLPEINFSTITDDYCHSQT
jgi:hypothetical protein